MSKIILGTLRPPLATNTTTGIIKGGDDITIGTGGEPVINTNYDTVDVNTDANIQNIVKGMKFKSILGNIVSALMGLNGDIGKINSDLVWKNLGNVTDAEYKILPSKYNDLEIIIKHGTTASSIRLSPLSISQWAGKQVALSFRYYDSNLKRFKFVDTTININASATGIAMLTVTVDDVITSDYICTAFYR